MSRIRLVHPDLRFRGGAEAVCVETLAALDRDHDVTLITGRDVDVADVASFFGIGTDLGDVDVRTVSPAARGWNAVFNEALGPTPIPNFRQVELAFFARAVAHPPDDVDLTVSTYNEFPIDGASLQYLHHPNFHPNVDDVPAIHRAYFAVARRMAGVDGSSLRDASLVANSGWTGALFDHAYGVEPGVIHPPVDADGFDGGPWSARENGVVVLGRLAPDKRIGDAIAVVEELVDRGHDLHLHCAGPVSDQRAGRRLAAHADETPWLHVEPEAPRERIVELLETHRFGLHPKVEEFGIAVAEMVAAGMLPFVRDRGGQTEIVDRAALQFADKAGAVEAFERVLDGDRDPDEIRDALPDVAERFGRERFREAVRGAVDGALAAGTD